MGLLIANQVLNTFKNLKTRQTVVWSLGLIFRLSLRPTG